MNSHQNSLYFQCLWTHGTKMSWKFAKYIQFLLRKSELAIHWFHNIYYYVFDVWNFVGKPFIYFSHIYCMPPMCLTDLFLFTNYTLGPSILSGTQYDLDKSVWEKSDITDSIIIRWQKRGLWGMKLLQGQVEAGLLEETK